MSYTALYRRFRPQEFNDVKGQEHIVKSLQNQIKNNRIGHAYLFTGTRGTGKTTIAKIFARAVNCESPVDGSPCGECAVCKGISDGSLLNVIEIDAASNNGVDNVREIIDEVEYAPTQGKYKVYIIDEVHMLSAGAFNALLKTLEEPPSYVMFILATTEVHKIPQTILSRCQRYDFRRITSEVIGARIKELTEIDGIDIEDKAVSYIARAADGSMRDGLSLLDQCIALFLGEKVTYEGVLSVLGAVDTVSFSNLLDSIYEQRVSDAIAAVDETVAFGRDLGQYVVDMVWYLRNVMMLKASPEFEESIDLSAENLAVLKEQAARISEEVLMQYILTLSELANDIKYTSQKRVLLEMTLIKMCNPAMNTDSSALEARISALEKKVENGVPSSNSGFSLTPDQMKLIQEQLGVSKPVGDMTVEEKVARHMIPEALPEEVKSLIENVNPKDIYDKCVPKTYGLMKPYSEGRVGFSVSNEGELELVVRTLSVEERDQYTERFKSEKTREEFEKELAREFQKAIKVRATVILSQQELEASYQLIDEIRAAAKAAGIVEDNSNEKPKFEV